MKVGVFIVDRVADFGLAAILEVLSTANSLREEVDPPLEPWQVRIVGLTEQVRSGADQMINTSLLRPDEDRFDVLIVPAVKVLRGDVLIDLVAAPENRQALDAIRAARCFGTELAAACTGTFFLAEAGVLDGNAATTSWWVGPAFRGRYPKVDLVESQTLCRGFGVTTAGAALAHLDLAMSLVYGRSPTLAELVGRYMMIGNGRPQLEFSIPEVIARGHPLVAEFERWVRQHLAEPCRISVIAQHLGTTERSLQRVMAAALGMSPTEFVHEIRLERAMHLLRTTALTTETVATRVGYLNAGTLRGLIRRRRGMTVGEVRRSRPSW